jgi:ligand-binding sensor domain-containing protein
VGGPARRDGGRWRAVPELGKENVTQLAPDADGGLFIATRAGVWHQNTEGALLALAERAPFLDPEVQALCLADGGLWIGTRTGLHFLAR